MLFINPFYSCYINFIAISLKILENTFIVLDFLSCDANINCQFHITKKYAINFKHFPCLL